MDASEYKEIAIKIKAELESLEIQQEDIERRIARLKQALIGLIPLSEPPDNSVIASYLNELSLTDAARQIIQASKKPLTPTEIKQQLLSMGKDLSGQKNVMASVHALLKRLATNEEIETRDNGLTYQWKPKSITMDWAEVINNLTNSSPGDAAVVPGALPGGEDSSAETPTPARKSRLIEA